MYEEKIIENLRKYAHIYAYDNQELSETCLRAYNSIEMLLYKYKMSLNEIEELQKPQWISVEKRLPDFEGAVLCMCKSHIRKGGKEIRYQTIMYFDEDVQWFSDVNDIFATKDAVTHWMPLPEPPKEEK